MDLAYDYKRDTDEAEKHFSKSYWKLWPNTHAYVFSLKEFFSYEC